jgi:putative hydrolase of the HAD superfamily
MLALRHKIQGYQYHFDLRSKVMSQITHIFVDIGEVLLTNGWDHNSRKNAAKYFKLDWDEMEERHRLAFPTFEEGRLTLEEYLNIAVFFQKRSFSRAQFRQFMFAQSKPYPEMLELMRALKHRYALKIAAVSNEARELNIYRIKKFKLDNFIDSFISSCYLRIRKPDPEIYRLALDITNAKISQVIYIENTPTFVQIAEGLGIESILHTDYESTCVSLAKLGLRHQ